MQDDRRGGAKEKGVEAGGAGLAKTHDARIYDLEQLVPAMWRRGCAARSICWPRGRRRGSNRQPHD